MKTILKYYMIPLILTIALASPLRAQQSTPSESQQQAQSEMKTEKKKERQRRKEAKSNTQKNADQVITTPQHRWLFSKKRRKNAAKKAENNH